MPAHVLASVLAAAWPFLLAAWFGAGRATDLFYAAQAASLLVVALAAGAFQDSAVVPRLARVREQEGASAESAVVAALQRIALVLGLAIAALFALVGAVYMHLVFEANPLELLAFVVPFAVAAPMMTMRSLMVACLQSRGGLAVPRMVDGLSIGLSALVVLCTHRSWGMAAVPVALMVGELGAASLATVLARRAGVGVLQFGSPSHPHARELLRLVCSEALGGAFTRVNPVIDQACVRAVGVVGAVTHVKYASDIAGVPSSVVGSALVPALFLMMSEHYAKGDVAGLARVARRGAAQIAALLIVASLAVYVLRVPLITLLFGHGKMSGADLQAIVAILPWGLANAVPLALMMLYVRANIAIGNSGIMWRVGLLNASLNIVLDVALGRLWGVGGVVLGTAVTHGVVAIVLYVLYRRASALLGRSGRVTET